MLNNAKLNRRIKKILKELKEKWRITPYRIAVEAHIPHASLKYMVEGKFEWKLNHLLSFVDFLNRYGAMISLIDLLDFDNKKTLAQIMNSENIDFRPLYYGRAAKDKSSQKLSTVQAAEPIDSKKESEVLAKEISGIVKESKAYKNFKVSVKLKISGKNFDYQKDMKF